MARRLYRDSGLAIYGFVEGQELQEAIALDLAAERVTLIFETLLESDLGHRRLPICEKIRRVRPIWIFGSPVMRGFWAKGALPSKFIFSWLRI